jgi:hypothetical protein
VKAAKRDAASEKAARLQLETARRVEVEEAAKRSVREEEAATAWSCVRA